MNGNTVVLESQTLTITLDEKCLWLKETVRPSLDFRERRRIQEVRVMRGDWPATYEWDMGLSESYNRGPIFVATGVVYLKNGEVLAADDKVPWEQVRRYEPLYRVGDAMDWADMMRSEVDVEERLPPPRDLIQEYVDRAEEIARWRTYRSTFGPGGVLVRN